MKKLLVPLLIGAVIILIVIFALRFVISLFTGAMNAILGVIVVIALIAIVLWMFAYAAKMSRKK